MTRSWYYWSGNREVGPLTLQDLARIAAQRRISAETPVRQGKDGTWVAASSVAGIFPTTKEGSGASNRLPLKPPPIPSHGQPPPTEAPEKAGTPDAQFRGFLIAGVSVCVLLAVVAIFMTLSDGSGSQAQTNSRPLPAAEPVAAATHSNWIARVKEKATRGVVLIRTRDGLGSGFVAASKQGSNLIVTNKHVLVGEAFASVRSSAYPRSFSVASESGRPMTGRLVALANDDQLDLALLLVHSRELDVLGPIARMDAVEVGDEVVAVGNPLDPLLANTVTNGIISGKHGMVLQTNAAINGGNSGGPLVNKQEQIVGVNTLTINKQFGEGISFSIRADLVTRKSTWTFLQDISDLFEEIAQR